MPEHNVSLAIAQDRGLGWEPGPYDDRDFALRPYATAMAERQDVKTSGLKMWSSTLHLDQGSEGACVGFGTTHSFNAMPMMHRKDNAWAHALYKEAQKWDPWPGTNYSGTSVRAGLHVAKMWGMLQDYAFETDVPSMLLWLLNFGTLVIGIDWMEGMDGPSEEADYFMRPTGSVRGGHCCILDGAGVGLSYQEDFVRFKNSWGTRWGKNSRAYMLVSDFTQLISRENSVVATAVEPNVLPAPQAA